MNAIKIRSDESMICNKYNDARFNNTFNIFLLL